MQSNINKIPSYKRYIISDIVLLMEKDLDNETILEKVFRKIGFMRNGDNIRIPEKHYPVPTLPITEKIIYHLKFIMKVVLFSTLKEYLYRSI